jgi:hypothetical protein
MLFLNNENSSHRSTMYSGETALLWSNVKSHFTCSNVLDNPKVKESAGKLFSRLRSDVLLIRVHRTICGHSWPTTIFVPCNKKTTTTTVFSVFFIMQISIQHLLKTKFKYLSMC